MVAPSCASRSVTGAAPQIGAGDLHAQVEQNLGNAAHADAADADEVRVLRGGKHRG